MIFHQYCKQINITYFLFKSSSFVCLKGMSVETENILTSDIVKVTEKNLQNEWQITSLQQSNHKDLFRLR